MKAYSSLNSFEHVPIEPRKNSRYGKPSAHPIECMPARADLLSWRFPDVRQHQETLSDTGDPVVTHVVTGVDFEKPKTANLVGSAA